MKRKLCAMVIMVAMTVTAGLGCGKAKEKDTKEEMKYVVGISQFAEHGSLDNCREGFIKGLEAEGFKEGENLEIQVKNAAVDMGTAGQIASGFVSDKVDMICAIATPSAQTSYNAAIDKDIPVVYTAITDPVAAELSDKDGNSIGNITGTSDKLPVEAQLKMIRSLLPEAKTIGIIYTTSEANSVSAIKEYEEKVKEYGFKLEKIGITSTSEVSLAAEELLGKVDCLTNLIDNTVVNSLATILEKANAKKIPVFGSEIEQVKLGCVAAEGIDYVALGEQTGRMAAQILRGEKKAEEMKFETITESGLYINTKAAENLGIVLDDEIQARALESFEDISK